MERSRAGGRTSRRGQNTVEYLLMVSVVVGVVLISGAAMKQFMPGLFSSIQQMITGSADSMGGSSDGASGGGAGGGIAASSPGYMPPGAVGGSDAVTGGNDGGTSSHTSGSGTKTKGVPPPHHP